MKIVKFIGAQLLILSLVVYLVTSAYAGTNYPESDWFHTGSAYFFIVLFTVLYFVQLFLSIKEYRISTKIPNHN